MFLLNKVLQGANVKQMFLNYPKEYKKTYFIIMWNKILPKASAGNKIFPQDSC